MNDILLTKDLHDKRYLLGSPATAANYYKQIKAVLQDTDLWQMFAEPVVLEGGARMAWRSSLPGKGVPCQSLSMEDQGFAKTELRNAITRLETKIKTFSDPELQEFFRNCIEIPDYQNLFLVENGGNRSVVITQWGFVLDTPGAEKGIINKIIEVKKVPMEFHIYYYKDGQKVPEIPAPNEQVSFKVNGKKYATVRSGDDAVIILDQMPEESKVSAYEVSDTEFANPQNFMCLQYGIYDVYLTPPVPETPPVQEPVATPPPPPAPELGDLHIRIVDSKGKPAPDTDVRITYLGRTETTKSDSNGYVHVYQVPVGTDFEIEAEKK